MRNEKWKPVLGYEGLYEVSNMGRLRALFKAGNFHKPGRILKPWLLKNGYLQVHLMKPGGNRKAYCVHRLLLESFSGPAPENCECRHLNGERADNTIKNLTWGTHKENGKDMMLHGRTQTGEKCIHSKLTEKEVVEIRQLYSSGWRLKCIAEMYGIDRTNVWNIATRRTWSHL